jgi:predicted transcriptional regulator
MEKQRELSDPITMRLPKDLLDDVETVAATCQRSRSWVIVRAIKAYMMAEGSEMLDVARARADFAAGLGEDLDDVLRDIDEILKGEAA